MRGPHYNYGMSIMKHPDPIGMGLASDVAFEAAGADCLVPGFSRPVRILGIKVWPWDIRIGNVFGVLAPVGRELKTVGKVIDRAFDLMNKPFAQ